MKSQSRMGKALVHLLAMAGLTLFVAGPTPGNVGGCGTTLANTPVVPGNLNATPPETAEYMFFDRGLCTYMCQRAFECGVMCLVVNNAPQNCNPQDPALYRQCVRGEIRQDVLGFNRCPHACAQYGGTYRPAYEWDVQACGEAILSRTCDMSGANSLGDVLRNAPGQCLNSVCPLPMP